MMPFLILFFSISSRAADSSEIFFERTGPQSIRTYNVTLIDVDFISSTCAKMNCQAYKMRATQPVDFVPDKSGYVISPLHKACLHAGGQSLYLNDLTLHQYEFCRFKDESFITSRSLLRF